jgi:CRP-like cAMP-binding protein
MDELTMTAVEELQQFQLFRGIDPLVLETLLKVFQEKQFAPGEVLFERGDEGNAMYLVRDGRIAVFIRDEQQTEIIFRHYGAGQVVGEFALLDGKPRSAAAKAADPLRVWILNRADFDRLLDERPIVGVELMRSLAERVRYTTDYLNRLHHAVELLMGRDYERALQEMVTSGKDDDIQHLINAFVEMVRSIRERNLLVQRTASQAKVEIDSPD